MRLAAALERGLDALDNPILLKELRGAFRRWRWLIIHTALLLGVAAVLLLAMTSSAAEDAEPSKIGRSTFLLILGLEAALVVLVFPAVTCTSIIEERSRASFDLLVTTRLGAPHIVVGKLLAAVVYGSLLIISTAPLVTVTFLYGGVSPGQIALSFVVLLLAGAVFATYGLLVSSLSAGTARAVVRTFLGVPAVGSLVFFPLAWLVDAVVIGPLSDRPWVGAGFDARPALQRLAVWAVCFAWPLGWGSLLFLLTVNQLQPERANRHTPLRVWFLVAWAFATALSVATHLSGTSGGGAWLLLQELGVVVVAMTLAAVSFVTEDDRPQRGRERRTWSPVALLLPGAARGAAFVLVLTALSLAVLWVLSAPAAALGGRHDGLRTVGEVRGWGVAWTAAFVLTVTQAALLAGRVVGRAAHARGWVAGGLALVTLYGGCWLWLVPQGAAGRLVHGTFLSPIPVVVSLARADRDLDRTLVLFGPSGDELRAEADRFAAELRRGETPAAGAAERDARNRERIERTRQHVAALAAQGVTVRTASTVCYGALGLGLLALNVALHRRDRRSMGPS